MPRENRKRGKKHKKKAEESADLNQESAPYVEEREAAEAGPSWIVSARDSTTVDLNAPFGYVDSEIKAYFRTVDVQIREWQETKPEAVEDADVAPNEGMRSLGMRTEFLTIARCRSPPVLCSRIERDVGEGETTGYRPRLLDNT